MPEFQLLATQPLRAAPPATRRLASMCRFASSAAMPLLAVTLILVSLTTVAVLVEPTVVHRASLGASGLGRRLSAVSREMVGGVKQEEEEAAHGEQGPAEILERQLRSHRGSGSEQELALTMSVGHVHRDAGRYAAAAKHYAAAKDLALKLGGGERLVLALQAQGTNKQLQGLLSAAKQDLETAYVLADKEREPEVAVQVLSLLADVKRDMGSVADSMELYKQAQQLAGSQDKAQQAALATSLGEAHARKGQAKEALALLERATKLREESDRQSRELHRPSDSEAPAALVTLQTLGGVHHLQGRVAEAMEIYKKVLRGQVRLLRPGHPDLVLTRLSVARARRDLGDAAGALEAAEAVERTLRAGPAEGPDLSRCMVMKGELLREMKRYAEADEALREALKLQGTVFKGEVNPEIAVALNGYGSLLHDQGKLNDALRNYLRALEVNLKTVGADHPETAATHNSIGTLYQDAGDAAQAQQHFEKCLEIQILTVGTASPDVATTYNNIATIAFHQGELHDAAKLFLKALEVLDAAGTPKNNPDRAVYRENLEEVVKELKKKNPDEIVVETVIPASVAVEVAAAAPQVMRIL